MDIITQRNQLDLAAKYFNMIKGFEFKEGLLLVEGESEARIYQNHAIV